MAARLLEAFGYTFTSSIEIRQGPKILRHKGHTFPVFVKCWGRGGHRPGPCLNGYVRVVVQCVLYLFAWCGVPSYKHLW